MKSWVAFGNSVPDFKPSDYELDEDESDDDES